jgi:hypothetical protein
MYHYVVYSVHFYWIINYRSTKQVKTLCHILSLCIAVGTFLVKLHIR